MIHRRPNIGIIALTPGLEGKVLKKDFYAVLGVLPAATQDEITQAFRSLAREYHPDRHVDNPLKHLAQERFKEISEAYHQLNDPIRRARYDQTRTSSLEDSQQSSSTHERWQTHSAHEAGGAGWYPRLSCHRHVGEQAVALCGNCNKGLCRECASYFTLTLCTACLRKHNQQYVARMHRAVRTPLVAAAACLLGTHLFWIPFPNGLSESGILFCLYLGRSVMVNPLDRDWGVAAMFYPFFLAGVLLTFMFSIFFAVLYGMTVGLFGYVMTVIEWTRARSIAQEAERYIQQMEAGTTGATA